MKIQETDVMETDESKVLSTDEVDALLKAAQEKDIDISKLINNVANSNDKKDSINHKAISNIAELTWSECEKIYSSFVRKKVSVQPKESKFGRLSDCLEGKTEKHVYSVFHITTTNDYCIVVIALPLIHQMINALYGGVVNANEAIIESPGKIGLIVSEKLCELTLDGFQIACKEYGKLDFDKFKTVILPNLISKLSMEDEIYSLTYAAKIGEVESNLSIFLPVKFLHKFIPATIEQDEDRMKQNIEWRDAIKNQVIDSNITIIASLPEITLKTKDLMALKEGDLIPIGDPTMVDVYLNDVKLFCATAGQANSNRIIKILSEK